MAVLKMQKISICALKKDRKAILEQLQHLGVLEVDRDKEEDAFFQKMDTTGQRMKFEKAARQQIRHWGFWMLTLRRKSHYFLRWKEKN